MWGGRIFKRNITTLKNTPTPPLRSHLSSSPMGIFSRDNSSSLTCRDVHLFSCLLTWQSEYELNSILSWSLVALLCSKCCTSNLWEEFICTMKMIRCWLVYMGTSPTLIKSSEIWHFEYGKVIETCNGTMLDFYPGLPHTNAHTWPTSLVPRTCRREIVVSPSHMVWGDQPTWREYTVISQKYTHGWRT